MDNFVTVLDYGYVRLVDVMGNDLTIVNSARVSYNDESKEFNKRDERLLAFLAREGHTSPFRHATMQFEVYAPLMVARQWWKYVVGSDHTMDSWNESSRRYVKEEPMFYLPDEFSWRSAPENSKQGSGEPLGEEEGNNLSDNLLKYIKDGEELYNHALQMGVCAEQARLFLPAYGMYVRWYWTASLQSVFHFVNQRIANDAQKEIQDYALAVKHFTEKSFPISSKYFLKEVS